MNEVSTETGGGTCRGLGLMVDPREELARRQRDVEDGVARKARERAHDRRTNRRRERRRALRQRCKRDFINAVRKISRGAGVGGAVGGRGRRTVGRVGDGKRNK